MGVSDIGRSGVWDVRVQGSAYGVLGFRGFLQRFGVCEFRA